MFRKSKTALAKDPVCGMQIDPAKAAGKETHEGREFHFCSSHCVETFRADPHRYGHGR